MRFPHSFVAWQATARINIKKFLEMQETGGLGRWKNAEGEAGDEGEKGNSQVCMLLLLMDLGHLGAGVVCPVLWKIRVETSLRPLKKCLW